MSKITLKKQERYEIDSLLCLSSGPRTSLIECTCRCVLVLLVLLLGSEAVSAEGGAADIHENESNNDSHFRNFSKKEWRWYLVPNFAFDTDDGFGTGLRGELARIEEGFEPYIFSLVVHVFASTQGFQHHRIRYDRTKLGARRKSRLTAHLAWRQWLNDGYYGIGNDTSVEEIYQQNSSETSHTENRYSYQLYQPFLFSTLRSELAGPWHLFTSLNLQHSRVVTYPESLLEQEKPHGKDGGLSVVLSGGLLYDTRKPEIAPRGGILAELGVRISPPLLHSSGFFGGGLFSFRAFQSIGNRTVLAARVMSEMLWGEVPFYEMVHWGGSRPVAGFGGAETLRGVPFGRWRAPGKAISNSELRFDVFEHSLRGAPVRWEMASYLDLGVVFGANDSGPSTRTVHPAAGVGIRTIYQDVFVGRIDAGLGLDSVITQEGQTRLEPILGVYVVFDHPF